MTERERVEVYLVDNTGHSGAKSKERKRGPYDWQPHMHPPTSCPPQRLKEKWNNETLPLVFFPKIEYKYSASSLQTKVNCMHLPCRDNKRVLKGDHTTHRRVNARWLCGKKRLIITLVASEPRPSESGRIAIYNAKYYAQEVGQEPHHSYKPIRSS